MGRRWRHAGWIAVLGLLVLGTTHGAGQPVRILFVGNSYTAGQGSAADLVQRMAAVRGIAVETATVAPGGYTLEQHWSNAVGTRDAIAAGDWDWVVLQEQSLRPIEDPERFFTFARLLDADIRAAGARTLFFLTWARQWAPESQELLNDAYCAIAEELGARTAPVGMAWALALDRDFFLELHISDGSHQNEVGQYLLGLAFHRRLWGDSPEGLPHDVSPHIAVSAERAAWLQKVATDAPGECPAWIFAADFENGTADEWSARVGP